MSETESTFEKKIHYQTGSREKKQGPLDENGLSPEMFHWTQDKKDEFVTRAHQELYQFLLNLDLPYETVQNIMLRYEENVELFKDRIVGPVHDEYHMAKVVHWAIDIWGRRKDGLPEDKRKMIAVALVIAAIEHDRGDIPRNNEYFADSQRSEARSARESSQFINSLALFDIDQAELRALVRLMISSTDQSLEMNLDGESLADLGISKLIRMEDIPQTEEAAVARVARYKLMKKDWLQELLLESVRMLNAADYASYYFEPAWMIEVLGLMVEKEEIFVKDGKLQINQGLGHYVDQLNPFFRKLIFRYYHQYYPQEAESLGQRDNKIFNRIVEIKEQPVHDGLFRLEGGLNPRDLSQLAQNLGLSENEDVQQALIDYSRQYRQLFSKPDASDFRTLGTEAIRILWKYSREEQAEKFFNEIFSRVNKNAEKEGKDVNLHLSPRAYGEGFLTEIDQHTSKLLQENELIIDLYLALRVDRGDVSAVDFTKISSQFQIALAGIPETQEMVEAMESVEQNCSGRRVLVHAGLQDDPQSIFNKISQLGSSGRNEWILHLDGRYKQFINWIQDHQVDFSLVVSPLVNLMRDPGLKQQLDQLREEVPTLELSSNNPVMAGSGGYILQQLVAG